MKRWICIAPAAALLAGCIIAVPGHLYPVQGPLAAQSPPPIYTVRISGIMASGTLHATLAGGQTCSGSWSAVSKSDPNAARMANDWDRVYGPGYFTANVLGAAAFAQSALACQQGSTLEVQFYLPVPGHLQSARGVAVDGEGNLYKLTF